MIFDSLSCVFQQKDEDVTIKRDDLARALMVCNYAVETSLTRGYAHLFSYQHRVICC